MSDVASISASSTLPPPTAARPAARGGASSGELSADEQRVVAQLRQRDREVRAHELTHVAVGGSVVTGGPTYSFERGPDGQLYAVGGEVQIDTSPGRTPEETIDKARQIQAAALAPAEPSAQDRQVAAAASRMEIEARAELAAQAREQGADPVAGSANPAGSAADGGNADDSAIERNRAGLARFFGQGAATAAAGELIDIFA